MGGVAAAAIGTCQHLHGTQAGMNGEKSRSGAARIRLTAKTRPKGKCRSFRQEQAILETRAENQQRIGRNAGMTGMTREKTRPKGKCRSVRQEQAILETCFKHNRLTASQKS